MNPPIRTFSRQLESHGTYVTVNFLLPKQRTILLVRYSLYNANDGYTKAHRHTGWAKM